MKKLLYILLTLVILATGVIVIACGREPSVQEVDKQAQEDILSRAQASEPVYQIQNFLSREAINEWLKRVDVPNKLWYIYLLSDSGAMIGYHVSRTIPLSYGVSITNPAQRITGSWGNVVMPAPGLDGVFYTGSDPSIHFCFDAETDALITFSCEFVYYDMPLDVEVPRLKIITD